MKRLVVWGARDSLDSLRHVWRAFHENAVKLGIDSVWVDDRFPISLQWGDTVIAADVTAANLPYEAGVDYVLHNFNSEASELCHALEQTPERLLRLQVWTNQASGEAWGPARSFDREARTLFQAWGSDLLREEFMEPIFNSESDELPFVGAIWSDVYEGVEMGNEAIITEVRNACRSRKLRFRHLTQISNEANVSAVRGGRLAPAFAGQWQVDRNYLPCRVPKGAAYGVLPLTNVPIALEILGGAALRGSVIEVIDEALSLDRTRYCNLVREAQRNLSRLTYRESLESISRAFEEIRG